MLQMRSRILEAGAPLRRPLIQQTPAPTRPVLTHARDVRVVRVARRVVGVAHDVLSKRVEAVEHVFCGLRGREAAVFGYDPFAEGFL